ncbi:hypothetical protein TSAR_006941, partial [Trichomalopsis sarcophagae]
EVRKRRRRGSLSLLLCSSLEISLLIALSLWSLDDDGSSCTHRNNGVYFWLRVYTYTYTHTRAADGSTQNILCRGAT